MFNFSTFPLSDCTDHYKNKIGVIDFETLGENDGFGEHKVYAGGWAVKDKTNLFYLKNNQTSKELILEIIYSIFNDDIVMKGNIHSNKPQYIFYAHNLGRFDGLFLIDALVKDPNIKFNPTFKDNSLLSLDIIYKFETPISFIGYEGKKREIKSRMIRNLDSLQMIKGSLKVKRGNLSKWSLINLQSWIWFTLDYKVLF